MSQPAARIDGYELVTPLGRGGAGVVFRARDVALRREVALKLLEGGRQGGHQGERFRREAEALARLRHPQVVSVHSVGEHQGRPYLVMDLIEGQSLAARIEREGPLPVGEAVRIARLLCGGLIHVHAHGLVHRDLKPDNVLIDRDGTPLLTDFGLVKGGEVGLSREGALLGTPGYWPPEQARGQLDEIDARADIYGLGATLYAMLTGVPPIHGDSVVELLVATLEVVPAPPSSLRPGVSRGVDAVCARCLAKRPADRYPSAAALAQALSEVDLAPRAGRTRRVIAAALLLAVAGGGVAALRGRPAGSAPPGSLRPAVPAPVGQPGASWEACWQALRGGAPVGAEAEAALRREGVPPAVWDQLEALPRGPARARLQLLACLLAERDEGALAAAAELGGGWRPALQLARDLRDQHAQLEDHRLATEGGEAHRARVLELLRMLDRAQRLRHDPLDPLETLIARRWQAELARCLVRLHAYQALQPEDIDAAAFARARGLVPDAREATYLDVVERWLIQDVEERYPQRVAALMERLRAAELDPGWDPVFTFLRGVVLLEGSLPQADLGQRARDLAAGEAAWAAASRVEELLHRFGRPWISLQGELSILVAMDGGERLSRTGGREGWERIDEAFQLGVRPLLGPAGAEQAIPPLEAATVDWLQRLHPTSRDAARGVSLALLTAGRREELIQQLETFEGDVGERMVRFLRAELELAAGRVDVAWELLEQSRGELDVYRDYWGAWAHARALLGDVPGAEEALARGRMSAVLFGVVWHDPEHVPEVLAGRSWWPGAGRPR